MQEQIKTILDKEQKRQDTTIELIASENYASLQLWICAAVFLQTNMQRDIPENVTTMVVNIWMK